MYRAVCVSAVFVGALGGSLPVLSVALYCSARMATNAVHLYHPHPHPLLAVCRCRHVDDHDTNAGCVCRGRRCAGGFDPRVWRMQHTVRQIWQDVLEHGTATS
jgi:hypothetical protein